MDEALLLNERYELHAGIDVSDGLSIDLAHLAEESGCGAVVETRRCRSPTTPAGWPTSSTTARRRWTTRWATARISS